MLWPERGVVSDTCGKGGSVMFSRFVKYRHPDRGRKYRFVWLACLMPALLCPPAALGASPSTAPATTQTVNHTLAALSLEDLMNVEVTSVSKKVQTISEAPAAISVISQDDIARS